MKISLNVNRVLHDLQVDAGENLLKVMRRLGFFSVKHGCETGECGACAVLLDGKPINSCVYLAAQAEGHHIQTIEDIGEHPELGWVRQVGHVLNFSGMSGIIRRHAPTFAQHTEEVLQELGYDWESIGKFQEDGVIL